MTAQGLLYLHLDTHTHRPEQGHHSHHLVLQKYYRVNTPFTGD